MTRFRFPYILTLSLSTLALGAVGCSNGQSPTEPAFDSLDAPIAASSSSSVSVDDKRHGADDPAGDDRGGQRGGGNDDRNGDDRGGRRGRGGDDRNGNDDRNGDDRGRRGRGGNDDNTRPPNPRPTAGSQFEARVLSVNGNTLNLAGGIRVTVNAQTQWIARGDLFTLAQVARSVSAGRFTRVEGRGTRQADGSFLAQTIKAEVDN
jgi:hypothetical protein